MSGLFLDQILGFKLVLRWVPVSEDGETFHRACIWTKVSYRVTLKCILAFVMEWALSIPSVCFAFPSLCNSHLIRISAGLEGPLLPTTFPKSQLTWIICPFFHIKIEDPSVNVFWFMIRIHHWYFKSHLAHELALLVFSHLSAFLECEGNCFYLWSVFCLLDSKVPEALYYSLKQRNSALFLWVNLWHQKFTGLCCLRPNSKGSGADSLSCKGFLIYFKLY